MKCLISEKDTDIIVLAVKPQVIQLVLGALAEFDLSNKAVLSIMAGIPIETLSKKLKGDNIKYIRTMPNTPLMVNRGVTGVYLTDDSVKEQVEKLFGATGVVIFVKTEDDLNKVTAISGSGPAYFFLFIEALSKSAQEMGFDKETSDKMAIGTALGASTLAYQSEDDVSILRSNVTSKGGTTEKAVLSFNEQNLDEVVKKATNAALIRSIELAKEFSE